MRKASVLLIAIFCISLAPITNAEDGHHHHHSDDENDKNVHWNGIHLEREATQAHVLTDQDGNMYSTQRELADATVVAFIFTTCPDVCPVITSNLKMVKSNMETLGYDIQFISITVDPEADSPEVLKEYSESYGADWPHLTGTEEELQAVWDEFLIAVENTEMETQNHHSHHGHDGHNMDHPETVVVVMPDGNTSENNVEVNAWHQFTKAAYSEGWEVNASESDWGHFVSGINGEDSPSDYSWWWELHTWDVTNESWIASSVGIDDLESQSIAFAPNSTLDSEIPSPDGVHVSTTIVNTSGVSVSTMHMSNAWVQTMAALDKFEAPDSEWGHYLESINGVAAPSDYSWWWELHTWNQSSLSWEASNVGMDGLTDEMHIAWAPNSTADSDIPSPENMVTKINAISHSTQTFILDADWKPEVVFTGIDWDVGEFSEDLEKVASKEDGTSHHGTGIPGFSFVTATAAIGLAIAIRRNE